MNREIEFRAWLKKENKMVNVKSIHFGTKKIMYGYSVNSQNYGNKTCKFEDCELMECTQLKDKNGTKIYEGDVVGVKRTYCNSGESEFALYSVVWKKNWCCWALDRVDVGMIQSCRLEPMETYEIVGNIYDTILKMPK